MIVKRLTERHLEFLSLNGGCTGLSESTLVKMSNCWKSHAPAQLLNAKQIAWINVVLVVKDIFVIFRKNETILILISLKRYFSHPEKSILNLSLP